MATGNTYQGRQQHGRPPSQGASTRGSYRPGYPLRLASPRKGVVVITSMLDDEEDRLARLRRVEARIAARRNKIKPWPEGLTADDLIAQAKEERYRDFLAL